MDTKSKVSQTVKCVVSLIIFFFTIEMVSLAQTTLNTNQLALRSSLQSFLKTEGFQPEIDSDGDIKFKRQGSTYFIRVSRSDDDPMYVSISRYFNYNDDITRTKIILFNAEHDYKMCKIFPGKDYFIIKSEMFLTTSFSFTNIFYRILQVMDGMVDDIKEL